MSSSNTSWCTMFVVAMAALVLAVTAAGNELVVNGDFDADTDLFVTWPGYVANGDNPSEVPDWFGTGGRGINPVVPNGPNDAPFRDNGNNNTSVAFLQGAATLEQDVLGFTIGEEYVLNLDYNSRNCCGDVPIAELTLNGELVEDFPDPDLDDGIVQPVGGNNPWYHLETTFFADQETMTIAVSSQPSAGGDASLVIDNVSIQPFVETGLRAGDANQDWEFNFDDILMVLGGGKFETGQPATWGQGDWNGAPGGSPGNPPAGDAIFDFADILAALSGGLFETGPYADADHPAGARAAAISPDGSLSDDKVTVVYDPNSGEVSVDSGGNSLSGIQIVSTSSIFENSANAQNLGGPFDVARADKIAKAVFGESFGDLIFGNVAQTGLDAATLKDDLSVSGTIFPSGSFNSADGGVDLLVIPEPSTLALFVLGLLAAVTHGGRRRKS